MRMAVTRTKSMGRQIKWEKENRENKTEKRKDRK
jgi:hypothetical protein